MLDMVAALLSGACATLQIPSDSERETKLSQVFIAMAPHTFQQPSGPPRQTEQIVERLQSQAALSGEQVRYPGERALQTRKENLAKGIPVEPTIWREVQAMS
jgi:3-dehydro-L-gulonate 2-dehydrogenase